MDYDTFLFYYIHSKVIHTISFHGLLLNPEKRFDKSERETIENTDLKYILKLTNRSLR